MSPVEHRQVPEDISPSVHQRYAEVALDSQIDQPQVAGKLSPDSLGVVAQSTAHDVLSNVPLYESGIWDQPTRIYGSCAAKALAEISPQPQPVPEPVPPSERPSKAALLPTIPLPKTLVAHLDKHVIGQDVA